MAKKIKVEGKVGYTCGICGLIYKDRKIAEECQSWCEKNNSCNLKITRNALNKEEI